MVKRGYGARIRDRAYDEALYGYRGVGGVLGALTVEFGERLNTRREEPTKILPIDPSGVDLWMVRCASPVQKHKY
jgi:hypothetical protein